MSTKMSLLSTRTAVRQRADMANSTFVSDPELNSAINQSYFELYDLLVNTYEKWYVAPSLTIAASGNLIGTNMLPLPNGVLYSAAPAHYRLLGVDLGLVPNTNSWVTLKRFNFINRNDYILPQASTNMFGVFNLRYDVVGDNIMFSPDPPGNQYFRLWYIPRLTTLVNDSDTLDGISGWTEYVIIDGAIKCGQKEETDVSILMGQKQAMIARIEASAMNRDVGQPATVSDVSRGAGGLDGPWGMGGFY